MTPEERAKWDIDPDDWPHSPPLHVFRELMDEDDNLWWRAGSGYGLNAYEQAIEEVERLVAGIEALAERMTPGLLGHPKDCRETCWQGPCTCSGERPVRAWSGVTPQDLRALLPNREQEAGS